MVRCRAGCRAGRCSKGCGKLAASPEPGDPGRGRKVCCYGNDLTFPPPAPWRNSLKSALLRSAVLWILIYMDVQKMFGEIDKYKVGLNINNWQLGRNQPTTYSVMKDDRLLNSIHSLSEVGATPAYEVEFSKEYGSMNEAYAARDAIYGDTSIVRSYDADKYSAQVTDTQRSLAAYLHAQNPNADKQGKVDAFWSGFQSDAT